MIEPEFNFYPLVLQLAQETSEPRYNNTAVALASSNIIPTGGGSIMVGTMQSPNYAKNASGWKLDSAGNIEGNAGTFRGALVANSLDIPDTTTVNSFHVNTAGDAWWGAAAIGDAVAKVLKTGVATFTNVAITGGSIGGSATVGVGNLNIANRGWVQTCAFSVTDADTVAWGAGTFTAADGTAYSISSGNTGNMAAKTYIYLDIAVSTTVYQTTTTATTAVGAGKVLVAIAQNGTGEATFKVLDGQGGENIDAANIVANSITANELSTSITYAGAIVIDTAGNIRSGQTAYHTGTGWFLGNVSGTPKFSIGVSTGNYLTWDGATLTISGILDKNYAAGTYAIASANTERLGIDTSYTKQKEIIVANSGTVTVDFDLHGTSTVAGYGRIYKNGVAAGTERSVTSTSYTTYSEDIAVTKNDLIQLYTYAYFSPVRTSDAFDAYSDGDLNTLNGGTGWATAWSGDTGYDIQGTTTYNSTTKAVQISAQAGTGQISRTFAAMTKGVFICYVRPTVTTDRFSLYFADGSNNLSFVRFEIDGTIKWYYGATSAVLGSYSINTWYKISQQFDTDTDQYRCQLDSGAWTGWQNFYLNNTSVGVTKITFDREGAGYTNQINIDEISISSGEGGTDDFEDYANGNLTGSDGGDGWTGPWTGDTGFDVQGTTVYAGTKAVQITGRDVTSDITRNFISMSEGIVQWYIRKAATSDKFSLAAGDVNTLVYITFDTDGNIKLLYAATSETLQAYVANTWYKVEAQFDCSTDQYRVRIDGGTWGTWRAFYNSNTSVGINQVKLDREGVYTDQVNIDDVKVLPYWAVRNFKIKTSAYEVSTVNTD